MCVFVCMSVCVCVCHTQLKPVMRYVSPCACSKKEDSLNNEQQLCVCVCVCVCERERVRKRKRVNVLGGQCV